MIVLNNYTSSWQIYFYFHTNLRGFTLHLLLVLLFDVIWGIRFVALATKFKYNCLHLGLGILSTSLAYARGRGFGSQGAHTTRLG